jgi:hypothetical protein
MTTRLPELPDGWKWIRSEYNNDNRWYLVSPGHTKSDDAVGWVFSIALEDKSYRACTGVPDETLPRWRQDFDTEQEAIDVTTMRCLLGINGEAT